MYAIRSYYVHVLEYDLGNPFFPTGRGRGQDHIHLGVRNDESPHAYNLVHPNGERPFPPVNDEGENPAPLSGGNELRLDDGLPAQEVPPP